MMQSPRLSVGQMRPSLTAWPTIRLNCLRSSRLTHQRSIGTSASAREQHLTSRNKYISLLCDQPRGYSHRETQQSWKIDLTFGVSCVQLGTIMDQWWVLNGRIPTLDFWKLRLPVVNHHGSQQDANQTYWWADLCKGSDRCFLWATCTDAASSTASEMNFFFFPRSAIKLWPIAFGTRTLLRGAHPCLNWQQVSIPLPPNLYINTQIYTAIEYSFAGRKLDPPKIINI